MSPKAEAMRRVASRVLAGAPALTVEERIQLFEDVAHLLPKEEAQSALDVAFALRQAASQQQDFLSLLK
jgi:hypothetical protein